MARGLRLGAGLLYHRPTQKLSRALAIPGGEGTVDVATAGDSVTWGAAAEIGPFEGVPLTLGVNYRAKSSQTLEGGAHFGIPPALQTVYPDQKVTHELIIPSKLDLGLAWRVSPKVLLVAGYTFDGYDVYVSDTFVGTVVDITGQPLQVIVPRNYENGWTLRVGGEWQAIPQLALRAGILRSGSVSDARRTGSERSILYTLVPREFLTTRSLQRRNASWHHVGWRLWRRWMISTSHPCRVLHRRVPLPLPFA